MKTALAVIGMVTVFWVVGLAVGLAIHVWTTPDDV